MPISELRKSLEMVKLLSRESIEAYLETLIDRYIRQPAPIEPVVPAATSKSNWVGLWLHTVAKT